MNTQTLVSHTDIRTWVAARRGQPAIRQVVDPLGTMHQRLALNFEHGVRPEQMPGVDDGVSPCSWSAWLAELDRQNLALIVGDAEAPVYELVPRAPDVVDSGHRLH